MCATWVNNDDDEAQKRRRRNFAQQRRVSGCEHPIASFAPFWLPGTTWCGADKRLHLHPFHLEGLVGDQMFAGRGVGRRVRAIDLFFFPPSSAPLVVFTVCLNPSFAFLHIRRLRFLFPPLSMHEVNGAGEHQRSIILLQEERSGRL